MGTMRLVVDARDQARPAEESVARIGELLADPAKRLWLDVSDPDAADEELLRRTFGFHELAPEEVTNPPERPRRGADTDRNRSCRERRSCPAGTTRGDRQAATRAYREASETADPVTPADTTLP